MTPSPCLPDGARPEPSAAPAAPRVRTVRVVGVALAGCGVVGGELARLLRDRGDAIAREHGVRFELRRVLVRDVARPRAVAFAAGVLTDDAAAFEATDAELVVEAMGGTGPAARVARTALGAGRRFVTANKALVAAHGVELAALARAAGGRLDFEGAVGGGVPVIRALRDSLRNAGVLSVRGIVNGTSNYVLTRLAAGDGFPAALREAQRLGYAEADPTRDLDGRDAADKLRVLAWLAFGVDPSTFAVRTRGLLPDPDRLARDAAWAGGVAKLLAECVAHGGAVCGVVEPVVVAADGEMGGTRDEINRVVVDTAWNGAVTLAGPGAGGAPTASALLSDMLRAAAPVRPRAAVPPCAPDARPHAWLLSIGHAPGAAGALSRALESAAVAPARTGEGDACHRVLTQPCAWPRIDGAMRALEARGLAPVASRCELRG